MALLCATVPAAVLATASAPMAQTPPPAPSASAVCFPACRSGYVCAQGQCVSACNPPCAGNQMCTSGGECVDKSGGAAPPPATTAPPATTTPSASSSSAPEPPPTAAPIATAAAAAEPPGETTPPPQEPDPDRPPTTAPTTNAPAGAHVHDGFYFRGGIGPALFAGGNITPPGSSVDVSASGGGPALELAFGGTLPHGVVVGGGIYGMSAPSPSYSANGASLPGGAAVISSIGPFVDWYFDPTSGFHAEAGVGLGVVTAAKGTATKIGGDTYTFPGSDQSGNGVSVFGGIGYEWWIGDQMSLGALARVQYVSASVKGSGDTDSTSVRVVMPALLGTLTYQ